MSFDALVRFEDGNQVSYGNLVETTNGGYKVVRLNGTLADGFTSAGTNSVLVKKVYIMHQKTLFSTSNSCAASFFALLNEHQLYNVLA